MGSGQHKIDQTNPLNDGGDGLDDSTDWNSLFPNRYQRRYDAYLHFVAEVNHDAVAGYRCGRFYWISCR